MKNKEHFVFSPDLEALRRFSRASAEEKLEWLEEAWRFILKTVPREKVERWWRLKKGSADGGPHLKSEIPLPKKR